MWSFARLGALLSPPDTCSRRELLLWIFSPKRRGTPCLFRVQYLARRAYEARAGLQDRERDVDASALRVSRLRFRTVWRLQDVCPHGTGEMRGSHTTIEGSMNEQIQAHAANGVAVLLPSSVSATETLVFSYKGERFRHCRPLLCEV